MFGIPYAAINREHFQKHGCINMGASMHVEEDIAYTTQFTVVSPHYIASVAALYTLKNDDRIYKKVQFLNKYGFIKPDDWNKFDSLYKHYLDKHSAKLTGDSPMQLERNPAHHGRCAL